MSNIFKYKNFDYKLSVYGRSYLKYYYEIISCDIISFCDDTLIINCNNFICYDYYQLVINQGSGMSIYSISYKECVIIRDGTNITIKSNNAYIRNNTVISCYSDTNVLDIIQSINRDLNFKLLLDV